MDTQFIARSKGIGFRLLCCFMLVNSKMGLAQESGRLRLESARVFRQFELPITLTYAGFSCDGTGIAFIYRPVQERPAGKQDVRLYWIFPGQKRFTLMSRKQLEAANLLGMLKEGYQYDLQPWNRAYASMPYSRWTFDAEGKRREYPNTGSISADNVHLNQKGEMVFGHVCYPYGVSQGIESGLYRWFPLTGLLDSLTVQRKHLYFSHIKSDNAWSALLRDSMCIMADITQYKVWLAGTSGGIKELQLQQPAGWVPFPDSLEARYNFLKLMKGEIRAWDTMKSWFEKYSRIEKIMANSNGDVLIRYTAHNPEGVLKQYLNVYRFQGDSLHTEKRLSIGDWPTGEVEITKENFSSFFVGAGTPTFLMNDRRLVVFHTVPEGKSLIGLKNRSELLAYEKAFETRKPVLAVYVYRFD